MPTLVDFPSVVKAALAICGEVCDTAPARRHFAAYLPGWLVADPKPLSGRKRALALTPDQACLHRWLTEVQWDG